MNFRLFCRQLLIGTRTDTWRRLSGVVAALATAVAIWWWHSSIPPQVKYAALGLLFLVTLELFWTVIKYIAYTDKSLEDLAAGYNSKTGAKKAQLSPEQEKALVKAMEG
jgi:hypothetical protein